MLESETSSLESLKEENKEPAGKEKVAVAGNKNVIKGRSIEMNELAMSGNDVWCLTCRMDA